MVCSGALPEKVLPSFKTFYKYCLFIFSDNDDNSRLLRRFATTLLEKDFNERINGYAHVNLIAT